MKLANTLLCISMVYTLISTTWATPNSGELGIDLKINITKTPYFPQTLAAQGYLEGIVKVCMDVDNHGELRDWIIIESTHPAFSKSIESVIDSWEFSPPYVNGENRSVVTQLNVDFQRSGAVVSMSLASETFSRNINLISGFKSEHRKLTNIEDLDTSPYLIRQTKPIVSQEEIEKSEGARAVFSFFVDEAGQVRLPALTQTDGNPDVSLILAAQDAISQ